MSNKCPPLSPASRSVNYHPIASGESKGESKGEKLIGICSDPAVEFLRPQCVGGRTSIMLMMLVIHTRG